MEQPVRVRRSGNTFGTILKAIGEAMTNPGTDVRIYLGSNPTTDTLTDMSKRVRCVLADMDLSNIDVMINLPNMYVKLVSNRYGYVDCGNIGEVIATKEIFTNRVTAFDDEVVVCKDKTNNEHPIKEKQNTYFYNKLREVFFDLDHMYKQPALKQACYDTYLDTVLKNGELLDAARYGILVRKLRGNKDIDIYDLEYQHAMSEMEQDPESILSDLVDSEVANMDADDDFIDSLVNGEIAHSDLGSSVAHKAVARAINKLERDRLKNEEMNQFTKQLHDSVLSLGDTAVKYIPGANRIQAYPRMLISPDPKHSLDARVYSSFDTDVEHLYTESTIPKSCKEGKDNNEKPWADLSDLVASTHTFSTVPTIRIDK
jgi:hypothetical protein